MCLMIVKHKGQSIPRKHIKAGFDQNPDGAGFMYLDDKKVVIDKGYTEFGLFYAAFKKAEKEFPNSPFVLHMRIGTSGERSELNCHPFKLPQGAGFAHNGILWKYSWENSIHSDTQNFVIRVLHNLPKKFWMNAGINGLLENVASDTGSKFVILSPNGIKIYNENAGEYNKGVWYSNNSYEIRLWEDTPAYLSGSSWVKIEPHSTPSKTTDYCAACNQKFNVGDLQNLDDQLVCEDCLAVLNEDVAS